jgi:hypothetical protein
LPQQHSSVLSSSLSVLHGTSVFRVHFHAYGILC